MIDPQDELFAEAFPKLAPLCRRLSELAGALKDGIDVWPQAQLIELANAGVLGWVIPEEFGGRNITTEELTRGYLHLTQACLTTTFILTQRNGACERLASSKNEDLKSRLLPAFCEGELFPTVGISHLTTSRQHLSQPAVTVVETPIGWKCTGTIPWVTGAKTADYLITGGTLADGRQLLVALSTKTEGVEILPAPELLALNATQTGSVQLQNVIIPKDNVIAGPVENVMNRGTGGGAGSLTTSALAIGLARAALTRFKTETVNRPDLEESYQPLAEEWRTLKSHLFLALTAQVEMQNTHLQWNPESIRIRANSFVLRMTQAYLAATKGAGFVSSHPASRLVREAMFFLVWSCPKPVLAAQLEEFACGINSPSERGASAP